MNELRFLDENFLRVDVAGRAPRPRRGSCAVLTCLLAASTACASDSEPRVVDGGALDAPAGDAAAVATVALPAEVRAALITFGGDGADPQPAAAADVAQGWQARDDVALLEAHWRALAAAQGYSPKGFALAQAAGLTLPSGGSPLWLLVAPHEEPDESARLVRLIAGGKSTTWLEYWAPDSDDHAVYTIAFALGGSVVTVPFTDLAVDLMSAAATTTTSPLASVAVRAKTACNMAADLACKTAITALKLGQFSYCVYRSFPVILKVAQKFCPALAIRSGEAAPAVLAGCVGLATAAVGSVLCAKTAGPSAEPDPSKERPDLLEGVCPEIASCGMGAELGFKDCSCFASSTETCEGGCNEAMKASICFVMDDTFTVKSSPRWSQNASKWVCRTLGAAKQYGPLGETGGECKSAFRELCKATVPIPDACKGWCAQRDGGVPDAAATDARGDGKARPDSSRGDGGKRKKRRGGWGDPHLYTADGFFYDFQFVGEFLTALDDAGLTIQTRLAPYRGSRTIATIVAVAANVAGDKVEVEATASGTNTWINDAPGGPATLPHGGVITASGITWPDGTVLRIANRGGRLDIQLEAGDESPPLHGLLGDDDDDPTNDLRLRDGTAAKLDLAGRRALAQSWRLSMAESLFHYGPGQSTTTFTDLAFPYGPATAASLPADVYRAARATCEATGVTDEILLEACILDVGLTGDPSFADSLADLPEAALGSPAIYPAQIDAQSLVADRVSQHGLAADRSPDGVFDVTVRGPLTALTLLVCDAKGTPVGNQWWDTVAPGGTWVLGVEENGQLINNPDGSLPPLSDGLHRLRLYAANSGYFRVGVYFRLIASLSDKSTVDGPVFAYSEGGAAAPRIDSLLPGLLVGGHQLLASGANLAPASGDLAGVSALLVPAAGAPVPLTITKGSSTQLTMVAPADVAQRLRGPAALKITTPDGMGQSTATVLPVASNGFGGDGAGDGFLGAVYPLQPNTPRLPAFGPLDSLTAACSDPTVISDPAGGKPCPFTTLTVPNLDIPPRSFTTGFPGLTTSLVEWFAIRFRGVLTVDAPGEYKLQSCSDDGSIVYVEIPPGNDGSPDAGSPAATLVKVVNNDGLRTFGCASGAVTLPAAGRYRMVVDYFQGPAAQLGLQVSWMPPGATQFAIVPPTSLTFFSP